MFTELVETASLGIASDWASSLHGMVHTGVLPVFPVRLG
jgi:hypothetical protein